MIQEGTVVLIADNTGAKQVRCFRIPGGTGKRYAKVGDIIVASIIEAAPQGLKKGLVVKAVIVRTKQLIIRDDGSTLAFYDNSCVIIDEKKNPKGTRIFGSIAREVREAGFAKIASLAPEVI